MMEKRPSIRNFLNDASSDLKQMKKWSEEPRHFRCSRGLPLSPNGLVAIDVDTDHDGMEKWKALIEKHGDPVTLKAQSGGGGLHYVFKSKPGIRYKGKIEKGLDIRYNNIIVVQPSIHGRTKNEYKWLTPIENSVQDYPDWIAGLIEKIPFEMGIEHGSSTDEELEALVEEIQNNEFDYDEWVRIGMALHSVKPNDDGLKLYLKATSNQSYGEGDYEKAQEKWLGFSNDTSGIRVGIGSVIHMLYEKGGDLSKFSLARDKKRFAADFSQFEVEKLVNAKVENGSLFILNSDDLELREE